jgi:hypothetical protein
MACAPVLCRVEASETQDYQEWGVLGWTDSWGGGAHSRSLCSTPDPRYSMEATGISPSPPRCVAPQPSPPQYLWLSLSCL